MSVELRIPFLKSPCFRVHLREHGVFKRMWVAPFPNPPGGFNYSADGALGDAWSYFPGLKVGKVKFISILPFFFNYLVALIMNRWTLRTAIIRELVLFIFRHSFLYQQLNRLECFVIT